MPGSFNAQPLPLLLRVKPLLQTRRFGREAEGYAALASTNTRAAEWAAEGAAEGNLVLAEKQTKGRGRHGRHWTSTAGLNLTFSVVLRPHLPPERRGLITLAAAVAVADTLAATDPAFEVGIKWPNDLLIDGRKCCGMLLESEIDARHDASLPHPVILGVGLNVNQTRFPEALQPPPTSLALTTGQRHDRARLLAQLLERLEDRYEGLQEDPEVLRDAYEERLLQLNEPITLQLTPEGRVFKGIVRGIASSGALQLETKDGLRCFHAGEVTTRVPSRPAST